MKIDLAVMVIFSIIAAAAFASNVYSVGIMALVLACVAIFVNRNYKVAWVRQLVDKIF